MTVENAAPSLGRMLRPRCVAAIGGAVAAEVVRQCRKIGYQGEIWPVHPDKAQVEGLRAYRSVDELPQAPDCAFIAVNRRQTVQVAAALAARGAGGAVCYASGFAEVGEEGADLQAALLQAAGTMPFLGPNCYGLLNFVDRAALWPDQHGGLPVGRGVAIITQSGNIGLNLTMQRRALSIAYLATLGNQASVGLSAMIEALCDDERVSAIGLHIEGIDDPRAFARACARARSRGLAVVALKTGRSEAGAAMTVSHTASLAGSDAVVDAYFRRLGVVRVESIPVLLETLKLLHLHGPLSSADIVSLSCSGGEAALMADSVEPYGLRFRPFDAAQRARVEATLTELVTVSNPFDYHTFAWGDEAALTRIFTATLQAGFGAGLLVLDYPRADRCNPGDWDTSVRAFTAAARDTGALGAVVASLPECMPEERALAIAQAGLVPFLGIEEALAALAAGWRAGLAGRKAVPAGLLLAPAAAGARRTLSEWEGKQWLRRHGVAVPQGLCAATPEDAALAAERIGFPVAVKAVGERIAHKTEIGALRLNLRSAPEVREAAAALSGIGETLLVESMITDGVAELIVGISRDTVLGLHLVIGAGGQLVELIEDRAVLLMPSSADEVREAVLSLRAARLLRGYRNRPAGDVEAVVATVLAIQSFAEAQSDRLLELDVNPLIVRPAGLGAMAADVLVSVAGPLKEHSP
jgi:acyl-CoA synthetase (NDP forming)